MSSDGVNSYIQRNLLDLDFRQLTLSDREASFEGFDLDDSDRDRLRTFSPDMLDKLTDIYSDTERVGFVRSFVRTERTSDIYAILPPPGPDDAPMPPKKRQEIDEFVAAIRRVGSGAERLKEIENLLNLIDPVTKSLDDIKPEERTPPHPAHQPDIFMVGLGINGFDQVTPEVERALRNSKKIFYIGNGVGADTYLSQFCDDTINLIDLYNKDGDRLTTYRNMAIAVVEGALDGGPVCFAEYGHPTIFSMPPFIIQQLSKELDLEIKIYPGISALDCLLAELMIDPCTNGMLMYEATDILVRERTLLPDVSLLIWQAASVETTLYSNSGSKPDRYFRLTTYLLKFYPPHHEIIAIYATNFPLIPSTEYRFPIGRLPEMAPRLHPGFTLYIPAVTISTTANYELAHLAQSVEHLRRISTTADD